MECHIDTGSRDDALHVGLAALSFMKAKIPYKCKEIFILQVLKLILFPKIDMSDWIISIMYLRGRQKIVFYFIYNYEILKILKML